MTDTVEKNTDRTTAQALLEKCKIRDAKRIKDGTHAWVEAPNGSKVLRSVTR